MGKSLEYGAYAHTAFEAIVSVSLASSAASFTPSRCARACSAHTAASAAARASRAAAASAPAASLLAPAGSARRSLCSRVRWIVSRRDENGIAPLIASRAAACSSSSAEPSPGGDAGGAAPSAPATDAPAAPSARPVSSSARRITKSAIWTAAVASSFSRSPTLPCSRSSWARTPWM